MQYWNSEVAREECTLIDTQFVTYKEIRQQKRLFFLVLADKDAKRAAVADRKKVSGGHFFSPGKSPLASGCIRMDVDGCQYWLERLHETGYIPEAQYKPLQNDCGSIRRMLIASINTTKSRQ